MAQIILIAALLATICVGLNANSVSTDEDICPQICPALYSPVCATDGKIYKEFSNGCELKASNCRQERSSLKTYAATLMDWCSTESVENLDDLMVKIGKVDLTKPACLKPCAMIYAPVCASNGKYRVMISNRCMLENVNCALGPDREIFNILRDGAC